MSDVWNQRFLRLAQQVSTWSKDPSTKVGAVIVHANRTIAAVGYNGFPRGCTDDPKLLEDRPTKYMRTVHAEVNAILSAQGDLGGSTLFVYPLYPCPACAGIIIQSGVRHVVAFMPSEPERWADQFKASRQLFDEAGVTITTVTSWSIP